ncbi:MAG: ACT domain-containing protein [Planctomycetota bacterium]|jgi:glycine cleavage system regulatory protein
MTDSSQELQHAALWLIGPDVPGLLNIGSKFVADRNGNIDKNIADKFGEKCVVFMSISGQPPDIAQMDADREKLKKASGCGVVFQPMRHAVAPEHYNDELYGFDIITNDKRGLLAEMTNLIKDHDMVITGHIGERRPAPGPRGEIQVGQRFLVLLPPDMNEMEFAGDLNALVRRYDGKVKTPLQAVPGLLWWR